MKVTVGLLSVLSAIAICLVLNLASGVFIPLLIAWLILQALNPILKPVIKLGKTLHLPRINKDLPPLANITLFFTLLIGLGILGFHFGTRQIVEFSKAYNQYYPKLNEMLVGIMDFLQIPTETLASFSWLTLLRNSMRSISEMIIAFASTFVMTMVFLMFMLLEAPYLNDKIDKAFLGPSATRIKNILSTISEQISNYLGTLALISAATGICVWFVLILFGVELAATWAVLTFLLNFIPTVGSIIATIPPVLMAVLQFSPSFIRPLIILVALTGIQVTIGNVITPKIVGDRLGLSPIAILISLLLWGLIWGIPGALLSVPIASILKIVCENIRSLRPIAILMGSGESILKMSAPRPEPVAYLRKSFTQFNHGNNSDASASDTNTEKEPESKTKTEIKTKNTVPSETEK